MKICHATSKTFHGSSVRMNEEQTICLQLTQVALWNIKAAIICRLSKSLILLWTYASKIKKETNKLNIKENMTN